MMVMGAFLIGVLITALTVPTHSTKGAVLGGLGVSTSATEGSPAPEAVSAGGVGGAGGVGSAGGAGGGAPGGVAVGVGGTTVAGGTGGGGGGGLPDTVAASGATGAGELASGPRGSSGVGGYNAAPAGGNGGATASGVTATSVNVGIFGGNSQAVSAACPRCGGVNEGTDEALVAGLFALWHKEGKLPIYGRDFNPEFEDVGDLDSSDDASACDALVAEHPLVILTAAGADGADNCFTEQDHILLVDGAGGIQEEQVLQSFPYFWELSPNIETIQVGFAQWANQMGLLKGQVIGVYSPNDASDFAYATNEQQDLEATFFAELKQLGYHVTEDYEYNEEGASDDPIAAAKMKAEGVTTLFIFGDLTEPSGFQNQAEQIEYNPKYPITDEGGQNFDDSLADVEYNANAENGNYLYANRWWNWSARDPATPADNPAAVECLTAFENAAHATLDVYNDDAKIHYILDECADLQVIRQAIVNAGPHLTQATFNAGMAQIQNMQTGEFSSITFGPHRYFGDNDWQSALFNRNRWQPSDDYVKTLGPYTPFSTFDDWPA